MKKRGALLILTPLLIISSLLCVISPEATEAPTAEEEAAVEEPVSEVPVAVDTQVSSKDGMVLVFVPAGEFEMGADDGERDEKPVHTVYLDAYWIDRTEVTNGMYRECV